ncbi:MAG: SDR family oxidoreductase, partial [Bacteroidales bacterium]|nr:SDR family oxidoreductase [Bacteroidales bacterium]
MYNPYSLTGKTVLVTGASSGIGRSVAVECSKMGATVIITGRNKERLDSTYSMLEGTGHQQFVADLSAHADIERLVDFCPTLDGVSNNAGIAKIVPVKFISKNSLEEILNTNTIAPILLTQMLVKRKKIKHPASIVFTSSLSGVYCVHYGESMYATSKGALNGFVKGAALELANQQVRVNSVNPSIIQTAIFENAG